MLTSLKLVETPQHGSISWHKVAAHLPNRNNKDCRKRWHYSIAHTIRKGTWTKEEDEKLLAAVEKHGARWSKVAVVVGSRNGDQCWKRWYDCLDPRIDKSPWTADEVSNKSNNMARGEEAHRCILRTESCFTRSRCMGEIGLRL
jgi:myb proto-oncogene protein